VSRLLRPFISLAVVAPQTGVRGLRNGRIFRRAAVAGGHRGSIPRAGRVGRPTDPHWTERRLVPLAPRTLARLEAITTKLRERSSVNVEPMQLAALLLEKTTEQLSEAEAKDLVEVRRRGSR
jgi:hypothetical protein